MESGRRTVLIFKSLRNASLDTYRGAEVTVPGSTGGVLVFGGFGTSPNLNGTSTPHGPKERFVRMVNFDLWIDLVGMVVDDR